MSNKNIKKNAARKYYFIFLSFVLGMGGLLILNILTTLGPKELNAQEFKKSRFSYLNQGINLGGWFSNGLLTPNNFQNRFTDQDISLIKNMGFKHVRLPLDPKILFNEDNPDNLNIESLKYLDASVENLLEQGLAVIVDLHPNPKSDFKQRLYNETAFTNKVDKFWRSLANHLSRYSPERVFLEVLNEPSTEDPQKWNVIQSQLLLAMRAGAPNHTLIAAANQRIGSSWNQIAALEALTSVKDPNVVYNFHFYMPMQFTHQGSKWAGQGAFSDLAQIPYPVSLKKVTSLLPTISNETTRQKLQNYSKQNWNAQKLEGLIQRAVAWRDAHGVSLLTCNEFGVYRAVAPPDDRNAWIRDVRSLLEKYQIAWTMWDYAGGFGVVEKVNGGIRPDDNTLKALFGSTQE